DMYDAPKVATVSPATIWQDIIYGLEDVTGWYTAEERQHIINTYPTIDITLLDTYVSILDGYYTDLEQKYQELEETFQNEGYMDAKLYSEVL
ncbi:hypothetical protein OFN62_30490, partial [Escherichia coli]|nr:hypothetical protein [Escherichia coli]